VVFVVAALTFEEKILHCVFYGRVVGQVGRALRHESGKGACDGIADHRAASTDPHAASAVHNGVAPHDTGGAHPVATIAAEHIIIGYYARGNNMVPKGKGRCDGISPHDSLREYAVAIYRNTQVLDDTAIRAV